MKWNGVGAMIGYLRLELSRTLVDVRYVLLAVVAPVGFYLLFASVFGGASSGPNLTFGLPAATEIMVAMATFGAMWAGLSATAPRLARDREGGWAQYLATTPMRPGRVLLARVAAAMIVVLPAVLAVGIAAVLAHGVRLAGWQWAAGLALVWVGTLPFITLGIAIGSLTNSTVSFALSTGLWFALAALGGLWVPPGVLSASLQHLAHVLPSYNQAALGWHVVSGTAPTVGEVGILAAWTIGLGLLPLAVRTRRRRPGPTPKDPQTATTSAIAIRDLTKRYGDLTAVDELTLTAEPGTSIALLGPNGSGKTTTMSLLVGLLDADDGAVQLFGTSPRRAAREGQLGVMLQDAELMSGVRVGQLLAVVHRLYPTPADLPALIDALGIADLARRRTDRLSGGQAQRVRFALAAAGDPALLVLDEPTAAMDVKARQAFWHTLGRHVHGRRTTVLFSTHYLEEADQHADRIVLIRAGRIVADGTPAQVKATGGTGRVVSFRVLHGDPQRFSHATAVISTRTDGDLVALYTSDADATIWSLYDQRTAITDLDVHDPGLEEAFLTLTATKATIPAQGP